MGKEYYTSGFAKKFLDSMDLNSGLAMKNLADKVWSNYGEIVKKQFFSIVQNNMQSRMPNHQAVCIALVRDVFCGDH